MGDPSRLAVSEGLASSAPVEVEMSAVAAAVVAAPETVTVTVGEQRISIRMLPTPSIGVCWGVALYEARRTARGAVTWQMVQHLSGRKMGRNGAWRDAGCWSEAKAWREAETHAARLGIPVADSRLTHGQVIEPAPQDDRYELVEVTTSTGELGRGVVAQGRTILGLKRRARLEGAATYTVRERGEVVAVGSARRGWRPPSP